MRHFRNLGVLSLALAMALSLGCARRSGMQTPEQTAVAESGDEQSLPFDQQGRKTGGSLVPTSEEIPAGTSITVRLEQPISSHTAHAGQHFQALVDEAVVVEGRTVLPRGTRVLGTILAARASGRQQGPGYLRVTLSSLRMDGVEVPVTTNSIFGKGGSRDQRAGTIKRNSAGDLSADGAGVLYGAALGSEKENYAAGERDISFSVERRLTFRLTQAVSFKN